MLFNKRLLLTHLNSFDYPNDFDFNRVFKIIRNWQTSIKNGNYDKTNEKQIQASFLNLFFNIILGHYEMNDNPEEWCLTYEAKTEFDRTATDGALGFFSKNEKIVRAVIELKDANTPLDKKQSSRKDYESPVSQAFSYSSKFDRCDWIIVSNFKEIRLYNKERGQGYYESFEVLNLGEEKEFKRFYFCLCRQNLLDKERNSVLDNLVKDTSKNEEEISKDFYRDFKALRKFLFEHICENNSDIDKKCVLEKTQKLLDRLVFVMFCEDSAIGLLPPYTIKNYYKTGKNLPIQSDTKVWTIIKGLFQSIDKGNMEINPPINQYNGGLFAPDEILDNLIIKDSVWEGVVKLAGYDFESDLNVNILGHIFEQSLNDLEQIKAEIDGVEQDNKKSKRKKDGIFYTPEYITRYIVEQTIGKYLEENPDKLETIKILDPACGSGAFLNQAHTFLYEQYKIRTEEKINSAKAKNKDGQEFAELNLFEHSNIADTNRSILLNNIYGVDLNSESTEITKLALWLKTAQKDQQLQNLDANIKCGNSLIDDETIAGDKAFNWEKEFPQVFKKPVIASDSEAIQTNNMDCHEISDDISRNDTDYGFDVIIGNPPYVNSIIMQQTIPLQREWLKENYNYLTEKWDIYVAFIEKALNLLKNGGYLSFIIPDSFLTEKYGKLIRKYIENNYNVVQIDYFPNLEIFENVGVRNVIIVIKKSIQQFPIKKIKHIDLVNDIIKRDESKQENIWANFDKLNLYFNKEVYYKLGDICFISKGIVLHSDKGDFKKEDLLSNIKTNIHTKKILEGEDISKYYIHGYKYVEWNTKRVPAQVSRPTFPELHTKGKLLTNKIGDLKVTIDNEDGYLAEQTVRIIKKWDLLNGIDNKSIKNSISKFSSIDRQQLEKIAMNYNNFFLLSILNSKLINYIFNYYRGNGSIDVNPIILRELPIPKLQIEQQQSLANKAEQMIELNKQLHSGLESGLDMINSRYKPKKISQKLNEFHILGKNMFVEEMKKQGVKLSPKEEEELIDWYKGKAEQLNKIKDQIDTLDHSIDQEVYKLYNLTDEEIKIIEEG